MAKIKSLWDAITMSDVPEDRCTNILLWLIGKLPAEVVFDICKMSGLSVDQVSDIVETRSQYILEHSRPDGLIIFNNGKHLLIETKRFPDSFDEQQFANHFSGGQKEFGRENIWLLFLSGDGSIPAELGRLQSEFNGQVGFISWKSLLSLLKEIQSKTREEYKILIEEFLTFANHLKLGRLISMNIDEIKKFLEIYPTVAKYEQTVEEKLLKLLDKIVDRIIMECEELVESNDDDRQKKLPSMYRCLKVKNWHTDNSGYVFLHIVLNKIGIILTGYQDNEKEKEKFLGKWEESFKNRYKEYGDIASFTWIDEGKDDYAIDGGYFKMVEGTEGKSFNPDRISETKVCFYFGYQYNFQVNEIDLYPEKLAKQFKNLLDSFND